MAFTNTQLAALERAIASGSLTVAYDGKTVTYRNMDDLIRAYNLVKGQLDVAGGSVVTNRGPAHLAVFDRG